MAFYKNASSEIISPHCVRAGVVHLFQLSSATSFGLHRYSIVVQQILMRSFRCELWQNSSIFSIMNNMIQMSYSAHGKRNTNLVGFFSWFLQSFLSLILALLRFVIFLNFELNILFQVFLLFKSKMFTFGGVKYWIFSLVLDSSFRFLWSE